MRWCDPADQQRLSVRRDLLPPVLGLRKDTVHLERAGHFRVLIRPLARLATAGWSEDCLTTSDDRTVALGDDLDPALRAATRDERAVAIKQEAAALEHDDGAGGGRGGYPIR